MNVLNYYLILLFFVSTFFEFFLFNIFCNEFRGCCANLSRVGANPPRLSPAASAIRRSRIARLFDPRAPRLRSRIPQTPRRRKHASQAAKPPGKSPPGFSPAPPFTRRPGVLRLFDPRAPRLRSRIPQPPRRRKHASQAAKLPRQSAKRIARPAFVQT
jgi:hypothetical protein